MEGSDNTSRSRLNGRTNDEASSEIDQRVDSAERDRASRRLIGADTTPDISKSAMHSLMSSRKIGSRMGSVNPASSSQNFRFQSLTVSRPETTPISSPSFAGFPYNKDAEEEKSDEDGFRGGNLGYEDMLARLEEVKGFFLQRLFRFGNLNASLPMDRGNHLPGISSPINLIIS